MSSASNLILGVGFCVVGILAAGLQYWLWTFPMEPDPTGRDPNGRTTAPPFWRAVHRGLGYLFATIYVVLLTQMLPRLPFIGEETTSVATIAHIIFGFVIAPVLVVKVFIIRRAQRFGGKLPLLGSMLLGSALTVVAAVYQPASGLQSLPASLEADVRARAILMTRCTRCHGSSPIVRGEHDDSWADILEEMSDIASDSGRPDPVADDFDLLEHYLSRVLPAEDDNGGGRRRRGRDRDD